MSEELLRPFVDTLVTLVHQKLADDQKQPQPFQTKMSQLPSRQLFTLLTKDQGSDKSSFHYPPLTEETRKVLHGISEGENSSLIASLPLENSRSTSVNMSPSPKSIINVSTSTSSLSIGSLDVSSPFVDMLLSRQISQSTQSSTSLNMTSTQMSDNTLSSIYSSSNQSRPCFNVNESPSTNTSQPESSSVVNKSLSTKVSQARPSFDVNESLSTKTCQSEPSHVVNKWLSTKISQSRPSSVVNKSPSTKSNQSESSPVVNNSPSMKSNQSRPSSVVNKSPSTKTMKSNQSGPSSVVNKSPSPKTNQSPSNAKVRGRPKENRASALRRASSQGPSKVQESWKLRHIRPIQNVVVNLNKAAKKRLDLLRNKKK